VSELDYARIERAILYLNGHFAEQPSLGEVAAHVRLSEYHFQRLFRRWAGISPKRFLQYLTAEHARGLLQRSRNVLEASDGAGLSSAGRLHDLMVAIHAATPGEVKSRGADLAIEYGIHPSPFGPCLIALTPRGICAFEFLSAGGRGTLARLRAQWPRASLRENRRRTQPVADRLFHFRHDAPGGPLQLHVQGTNFQVKVWEALLRIPLGAAVSYEDIAAAVGVPHAARAVGSAIARNPVALLIPCHRVIRKSGALGEYHWGATRKQAILGWEAARSAVPSG
jgi:AraC family transcriptional regulator, regulatory protein of adaptative response / methylated-DNA-[protein]-cysteine methyltransferase